MKNIIIGTAGHIDHGKTTLIKALTGRETDRLKEEQERGISIELGFTYFDLPSGRRAGIIDVPGHEKFIKNMLAGIIGIDIVALVVAADEGVMPQTKEHLAILNLLGIKKGIVVLTKADLVDEEWLELVQEDIRESLKGTFLEESELIPVSSISKMGIDRVVETIDRLTEEVEDRDISETPRLPVDRVFTISGFGTVVTGTLVSGALKIGDEVQIFPGNKTSRIRSIQVHGKDSDVAYAGQRAAINLAGLKKSEIDRGNIIAPIGAMESTMMLDVKLRLLEDSQRIIDNRTRLRLYTGTSEVMCRVVFLDRDQLTPGESCYAQLRLEEELVAKRGDKFIIRFYSPMMTIGGGEVLESNPPKRKRHDESVIEELKIKEKGDTTDIIEKIVKDKSKDFPSIKDIATFTIMPEDKVTSLINELINKDKVVTFTLLKDVHVVHKDYEAELIEKIKGELRVFHQNNPLKSGMAKEEIRSRYLGKIKPKIGENFISMVIDRGILKQSGENLSLSDFEVRFSDTQEKIKSDLENIYLKDRFAHLKREETTEGLSYGKNEINQVFDALLSTGILIRLKDDIIVHRYAYEEAKEKAIDFMNANKSITAAQLRDLLNTSRKVAIAIVEYLDQAKVTKRLGDERILYK